MAAGRFLSFSCGFQLLCPATASICRRNKTQNVEPSKLGGFTSATTVPVLPQGPSLAWASTFSRLVSIRRNAAYIKVFVACMLLFVHWILKLTSPWGTSFVPATSSRSLLVRVWRDFLILCDPSCVSSVFALSPSRKSQSVGRQIAGHLPFDFWRSLLIRIEFSRSRSPSIIPGRQCGFRFFLAGLHCGSNITMFLAGFYHGFHPLLDAFFPFWPPSSIVWLPFSLCWFLSSFVDLSPGFQPLSVFRRR
jgi:hypothetical protein